MDKNIVFFFIILSLIYTAWSSQLQPVKQYIISGLPSQPSALSNVQTISLSNSTPKPSASIGSLSTLASLLSSGIPTSQHVPAIPAISLLTESNLGAMPSPVSSVSLESLSALASLLTSGGQTSQHLPAIPAMTLLTDPNAGTLSAPISSTNLGSLSALAKLLSSEVPTSQHVTTVPLSLLTSLSNVKPTKGESNTVDIELLNNLAIALQLMIVNNILNSPLPETSSAPEPVVVPAYPLYDNFEPITPISISYTPYKNSNEHSSTTSYPISAQSQPYYSQNSYENQPSSLNSASMPNANFVGTSGFGDSNPFMSSVPPASLGASRTGFTLMSPYEALSPGSPYSDPILSSPYGSVISSKKDFQSPYTAILAADNNRDLFSFSMNDLF